MNDNDRFAYKRKNWEVRGKVKNKQEQVERNTDKN